jgi:hypothetical protein
VQIRVAIRLSKRLDPVSRNVVPNCRFDGIQKPLKNSDICLVVVATLRTGRERSKKEMYKQAMRDPVLYSRTNPKNELF